MGIGPQIYDIKFQIHRPGGYDINFEISDEDSAGNTKYYGYLSSLGAWVIMQYDSVAGSYRYAAGIGTTTSFTTAWANRAVSVVYYKFNLLGDNVLP